MILQIQQVKNRKEWQFYVMENLLFLNKIYKKKEAFFMNQQDLTNALRLPLQEIEDVQNLVILIMMLSQMTDNTYFHAKKCLFIQALTIIFLYLKVSLDKTLSISLLKSKEILEEVFSIFIQLYVQILKLVNLKQQYIIVLNGCVVKYQLVRQKYT